MSRRFIYENHVGTLHLRRGTLFGIIVWATCQGTGLPARADTINQALIKAYENNPQLNSQRAVVRATDEGVPQALSGYRPTITATGRAR